MILVRQHFFVLTSKFPSFSLSLSLYLSLSFSFSGSLPELIVVAFPLFFVVLSFVNGRLFTAAFWAVWYVVLICLQKDSSMSKWTHKRSLMIWKAAFPRQLSNRTMILTWGFSVWSESKIYNIHKLFFCCHPIFCWRPKPSYYWSQTRLATGNRGPKSTWQNASFDFTSSWPLILMSIDVFTCRKYWAMTSFSVQTFRSTFCHSKQFDGYGEGQKTSAPALTVFAVRHFAVPLIKGVFVAEVGVHFGRHWPGHVIASARSDLLACPTGDTASWPGAPWSPHIFLGV